MEKIIVNVALAVLLVVMYQVRWFLQHQPLKLCKRRQRIVWSFMLKVLWKMEKMFRNG